MAKKEVEYYIGSIVGGAIGDALGAPIEFINLSTIIKTFGNDGVNDYVEFSDGKG
jgi:ADP-ribosylglycohydrolase